MTLGAELAAAVRVRAANRCQYCLMHQSLQGATFHVEHVVPRSKGGSCELPNLASTLPSASRRRHGLWFTPLSIIGFAQLHKLKTPERGSEGAGQPARTSNHGPVPLQA